MAAKTRTAYYEATLIYVDEPQLLLLKSGTIRFLAVAAPSETPDVAKFLAVTVRKEDWERYINESCDLHYLFTYPRNKILYYFDLMKLKNNAIKMTIAPDEIPQADVPLPRIFASHHTNDWEEAVRSTQYETLDIDGHWEMSEFGKFYEKYADVYALISSIRRWKDHAVPQAVRASIKNEFTDKPFKGGSSYLHLFDGLLEKLAPSERPSLRQVKYASPGFVKLRGETTTFSEMESVVRNFLVHRNEIQSKYTTLHNYLSKTGLLTLAGDNFPANSPYSTYINVEARTLADLLAATDYDDLLALTNDNALVAAKVVLATFRRIAESSAFFAQGRMAFQ